MRFTVIDQEGTMSFVGPCHAMKMLTAACSRRPEDHRALLAITEEFDPRLAVKVRAGLSHFDARWSVDGVIDVQAHLGSGREEDGPPFRVVDEATRRRSLEPVRAGLVVFNLNAKRIVQVQNSYSDLQRKDRGRLHRDGRPVRAYYSYELPPDWRIVP